MPGGISSNIRISDLNFLEHTIYFFFIPPLFFIPVLLSPPDIQQEYAFYLIWSRHSARLETQDQGGSVLPFLETQLGKQMDKINHHAIGCVQNSGFHRGLQEFGEVGLECGNSAAVCRPLIAGLGECLLSDSHNYSEDLLLPPSGSSYLPYQPIRACSALEHGDWSRCGHMINRVDPTQTGQVLLGD